MATSTDIAQLRRLVKGSSAYFSSTADVGWYVDQGANLYYAAAEMADAIAGYLGAKGSKQVGDLRVDYAGGVAAYHSLAERLRARGSRGAVPFAGGITQSDKDTEEADTDRVRPAFVRGMHDYSGSSSTGY